MQRFDRYALAFIVGTSVLGASALTAATAWHAPAASAPSTARLAAQHVQPLHETLVIATPDMLGSKDLPAYVPSALTLPANTTVTITVVNFDDATALSAGSEKFAVPTGVIGPLHVQSLDPADPNAVSPASDVTAMDPAKGVSHTFTVAKLGINVPIAPKSKTTFTIRTGRAGTYDWQCMDPCGSDPNGWGGAMATSGYMRGTLTVV